MSRKSRGHVRAAIFSEESRLPGFNILSKAFRRRIFRPRPLPNAALMKEKSAHGPRPVKRSRGGIKLSSAENKSLRARGTAISRCRQARRSRFAPGCTTSTLPPQPLRDEPRRSRRPRAGLKIAALQESHTRNCRVARHAKVDSPVEQAAWHPPARIRCNAAREARIIPRTLHFRALRQLIFDYRQDRF